MAHLPPGGVGQLATRDDLRQLEQTLRMEIRTGLGHLRAEVRSEIQDVRIDIQTSRGEAQRTARNTILAFVAIMAAMNGLLAAFLTVST